ncbi:mitochondrial proton/calcium exchanger protein-like protein isoform X1 [Tanacetum coccineum]
MTRSSTKELFTPFEDSEQEVRSSRKLFKTLSLESRSFVFDLFSDLEENSKEEVAETMAETMEEYMSKTRADFGSGVTRPKIDDKDHFELNCQFLKELRDNTFSDSNHEDANEHIEKVLEIVDLFHVPNITQDQIMLRAFPISVAFSFPAAGTKRKAGIWVLRSDCEYQNCPLRSDDKIRYANLFPMDMNDFDVILGMDSGVEGVILCLRVLSLRCLLVKGAYGCILAGCYTPARTSKKIEDIINFQQEPDETIYQAWERFKESLMKCPQHYLTEMQEMAEYSQKWHNGTSKARRTKTSNGLAAIQAQLSNFGREIKKVNEKVYVAKVGWQNRAATLGFYQRNNANPSYQEWRQSMEESLSKFMNESTKRHEENCNMIKEIRASTGAAIRNQRASIKTLEIQIGQMSKNSKLILESRQVTIPFPSHLNGYYYDEKGLYGLQYLEAYSYGATRLNNSLPRKEKDPGSFTLPCYINNICFENALADLGASVSVMPLSTYLNLGLGELAHTKLTVELADRTVKHPKGIVENVLVGIGKFIFPIDFIILDVLEDVKVPLILRRPFLSTAHVKIDLFERKITLRVREEKNIFKCVKPASSLIKRIYMLSLRERMELDLEARLMGETLVLNRSLGPLYGDYIELNDLNIPLELRRNQVEDLMPTIKEGEVVDKTMIEEVKTRNDNKMVSKIIGYPSDYDQDEKIRIDYSYNLKFSCMIVVEDMDPYLDKGMGEVVIGEPFCQVSFVETRRFDGIITIRDEDDSVTYQMVRSNPRFKHLTNEQYNEIPPLLKVREQDKMNGISHSYQKLKGFYKGILNLEPNFIRYAKMEEWLTRGHISVE